MKKKPSFSRWALVWFGAVTVLVAGALAVLATWG